MSTRPPREAGTPPIEDFDWAAPASAADEQAATWLVRLTSGHATDAERAAFARWRDADPAHEQALSRLRAVWGAVSAVPERKPSPPPVAVRPSAAGMPRARRRRWRGWAVAAALLAAVAVAYQTQMNWRHDEVAASGQRRTLALEDGSTVLLGGGTALDVAFDADTRRVHLARGEAYFEVKADADRPFVIDAGAVRVQVVGTRFSVRRDAGAGEVTVVDGRVRVDAGASTTVVEADQQLRFDEAGFTSPVAVNADEALAWRSGRLVVNAATLDQIAALINRHRAGTIVVRVDAARQVPINAVIDLDHVDEWLAALEQQGRARVARLGPVTLVY